MRKLAMLSTAMLGLAFAVPSHAQPANSAPQPGLPPGAAVGAPNAQQPLPFGDLKTTPTGSSRPYASETTSRSHRAAHHRRARHRRHHAAPATMAPVTPQ